ncbi:thioredoxin [Streptomyces armeniacus]|uniref:Thioredoxin n=1 Tax=Streptomyces armeniacus TaxID=83291 RepID=A0A345XQE5_9ACTN|nr:thioredoxin family protein [Streptomyces armeniacus]AXK33861.1 thioredoxin [Streptomyces armeniacus]
MLRKGTVVAAAVVMLLGGAALPAFGASPAASQAAAPAPAADPTVIDVTSENYQQVMEMSKEKPVVLDFTAEWCQWCQKQKPYLQRYHDEDDGSWIWARVDVDRNPDLQRQWGVRGIPALLNIQNGEEAGSRLVGFDGPESLRRWLSNL